MNCLKEKEIEKVILNMGLCPSDIQEHIFACDRCREIFLMLQRFYHQFNTQDVVQKNDSKTDNSPAGATILSPIQRTGLPKFHFKLAAQDKPEPGSYHITSFSNKDEEVVGRIFHNTQTREVSIFLVSADIKKIQYQKVTLEGTDIEGITDDKGEIHSGAHAPFSCTNMHIESPVAFFDLSQHTAQKSRVMESHSFTLLNENHDKILIDIKPSGQALTYRIMIKKVGMLKGKKILKVVAVTDRGRHLSSGTQKGVSILETKTDERILKIFVC
jgi:hypothetical protein